MKIITKETMIVIKLEKFYIRIFLLLENFFNQSISIIIIDRKTQKHENKICKKYSHFLHAYER